MKIAQIARLYESVPPRCYGGTGTSCLLVTERLVELGLTKSHCLQVVHSISGAKLVSPAKRSLRNS